MNKFLLGAVAIAVAAPVSAQMPPPPPMAPMAPQINVTQTRDQVVAKIRDHFAKMDTNRDGFVAGDEMKSIRGQHQRMNRQMGERRSRDGDRMAARGGAGRDPAAAFDRLDANRDGMISRDEFGKGREVRIERKFVRNATRGAPGSGMDGMPQGMRNMRRMHGGMMRMADLDRDGRVSLQEATTSALQRFDRVDANRDGRITPDERSQNRDRRQQMRAPKAG